MAKLIFSFVVFAIILIVTVLLHLFVPQPYKEYASFTAWMAMFVMFFWIGLRAK